MKKYTKILLALLLALTLLSLSACGDKDAAAKGDGGQELSAAEQPSQPQSGVLHRDDTETDTPAPPQSGGEELPPAQGIDDTPPLTLDRVMNYLSGMDSGFTPHVLSPDEQTQLRRDVEAQGGSISFAPDGSFTVSSPEGGSFTLAPDGVFSGVDDDGAGFGMGASGQWPSGPLAAAVPQPDFDIMTSYEESGSLDVIFTGVTLEQAKAYGAQLKSLFPLDADEFEYAAMNMYGFSGESSDGIRADLTFMDQGDDANCYLSIIDVELYDEDDYGDYYDDGGYYGDGYGGYYGGGYGYGDGQQITDFSYGDSWPTSGLLALLPAPDFGDDLQVRDDYETMTGSVYGAVSSDFDAYLSIVKAKGFTIDSEYEEDADYYGLRMYSAYNSEGNGVFLQYMETMDNAEGVVSIIVSIPE